MKKTLLIFALTALNAYALNCVETEFEIRKNEYDEHKYDNYINHNGYSIGETDYVFIGFNILDKDTHKEIFYYTGNHLDSSYYSFSNSDYTQNICSATQCPENKVCPPSNCTSTYTSSHFGYKFKAETKEELTSILNEYHAIIKYGNSTKSTGENPKIITRQYYECDKEVYCSETTSVDIYHMNQLVERITYSPIDGSNKIKVVKEKYDSNGELISKIPTEELFEKTIESISVYYSKDSVHMEKESISYSYFNEEENKYTENTTRTMYLKNDSLYIYDGRNQYLDEAICVQDKDSENRCHCGEKENLWETFKIEMHNDTLVRIDQENKFTDSYFYLPVKKDSTTSIIPKKIYPIAHWRKFKHFDLLGRPALTSNKHIIKVHR